MKVIRIDSGRLPGDALTATLMADSCWRPHMRPLFLPEDADSPAPATCEVRHAIRIDRLGKAIREKFAPRYIGAWTLVNYSPAAGDDSGICAAIADDALIHGEWLPVTDSPVELKFDGEVRRFAPDIEAAARALELLSAHATFKTGDILLMPGAIFTFTPERDRRIDISADGATCLRFNVK